MKIVRSLEESDSLTMTKKAKEQKSGFLSLLLGTLGPSVLGNLLTAQGATRADKK